MAQIALLFRNVFLYTHGPLFRTIATCFQIPLYPIFRFDLPQKWRPPKPKQAAASTATKAPATTNASQAQVAATASAAKQLTDQDIVTQQQSLTIVKTLLGATFGCVTYLR